MDQNYLNEVTKIIIMRRRIAVAGYLYLKRKRRNTRRWWVHPMNAVKTAPGIVPIANWEHLIQEMRLYDEDTFFNHTRLTVQQFDYLLSLVGPQLKKENLRRKAISEGARLSITLRHLATGDSLLSLSSAYGIGKSTACVIIKETCDVLYDVLHRTHLKLPIKQTWIEIAKKFNKMWNLPNCTGAIDAKHVVIKTANNAGNKVFINEKSTRIVLFAICDADYMFTYADIGAYGLQTNGGVLKESVFGQQLLNNELQLPTETKLLNSDYYLPYFFVGDEEFPLLKNLMRPYSGRNLSRDKKIFNYRLLRAHNCIDNAFGIMVARFKIFDRVINSQIDTVNSMIKTAICLHNFIMGMEREMDHNDRRYCSSGFVDQYDIEGKEIPGSWRNAIPDSCALVDASSLGRRIGSRNFTDNDSNIRDNYSSYFNSAVGAVPWQTDII